MTRVNDGTSFRLIETPRGGSDREWTRANGDLTTRWATPTITCKCTRGRRIFRGFASRPIVVPPGLRNDEELVFPPRVTRVGKRTVSSGTMPVEEFPAWKERFAERVAAENGLDAGTLRDRIRPGMPLCPAEWKPGSAARPEFVQPMWSFSVLARVDVAEAMQALGLSGVEFSAVSTGEGSADYRLMHVTTQSTEDVYDFVCDVCGGVSVSGSFEDRIKNRRLRELDFQLLFGTLRVVVSARFARVVAERAWRGIDFDEALL